MKLLQLITLGVLLIAASSTENNIPLIGILMQNGSDGFDGQFPSPNDHYVYVANSYVEWVAQTGAIPVLVPFDLPPRKFTALLNQLDGFLLPGGGTDLKDSNGNDTPYHAATRKVLRFSEQKLDKEQKTWPVYGICLGYEDIGMHYLGNAALTDGMNDTFKEHPVFIEEEAYKDSRFFSKLNQKVMREAFERGNTYYYHDLGFDYEILIRPEFTEPKKNLLILGHSFTDEGIKFVAFMEHKKYPVFASLFHPEKVLFERGEGYRFMDRSSTPLDFSADIANTFVDFARQNARDPSTWPTWIQPYFSTNWTPINTFFTAFERIFMLPRLYASPPPSDNSKLMTG